MTEKDFKHDLANITLDSTAEYDDSKHHSEGFDPNVTLPERHNGPKERFVRQYYGYIAVAAGLLNGLQVFLFEIMVYTQIEHTTISLYYSEFLGFFMFFFIYYIKDSFVHKHEHGTYWSLDRLSFLQVDNSNSLLNNQDMRIEALNGTEKKYKLNKFNIMAVLCLAFISVSQTFLRFALIYAQTLANINFSLIASFMALTPFLIAFAFYFVYKERLNTYHIVGISVILISSMLMTASFTSDSEDAMATISPIVCAVLAVIIVFLNVIICLVTRYFVLNSNLTVQQLLADSFLFQGITFLILFLLSDYNYSATIFWKIAGIQFIGFFSSYILYEAVTYGKAAPSQALNNTSSFFAFMLEIIFLNKVPTNTQISAFFIGMAGSCLVAFEASHEK